MKNGCMENAEVIIVENNERAKKIYRYVSDVARRIDDALAGCRNTTDLFTTNLEVQRQKLRDNCEKLMFLDPLNYGKKCLELLWRKVYYETVSAAKKVQTSEEDYDNYLFTHIVCGIGHFHHLITRIQYDMKLQIRELDYVPLHNDEETEILDSTGDSELRQWGRSVLHSCLIYLGDLSRYQVEIFHAFDPSIAARYYLQASHLDLCSGMPYNQLGNLYMEKNYNLDSVCYYIHCLSCPSPFDGAMGNMTKLFEKNSHYLETVVHSDNWSQNEHIQDTLARFLSLIEMWYLGKENAEISTSCNIVVHALKVALEFKKVVIPIEMPPNSTYTELMQNLEDEHVNPSYINANIIHKIVQISLFTVSKMCETDEKSAFAAKAFTLALLSQLLQKLLQQLFEFGLRNPASKYRRHYSSTPTAEINIQQVEENDDEKKNDENPIIETNGTTEEPDITPNSDIHNGGGSGTEEKVVNGDIQVTNKKSLAKRRRRRRAASSESSDVSDSETETSSVEFISEDSDCSVSDDDCESDAGNEDQTQLESNNGHVNGAINVTIGEKPETHNEVIQKENIKLELKDIPSENLKTSNSDLDPVRIQNFLRGDNFLASLKLLQDWALTEKELILSCGESGESLFQCVVDLLNIMEYNFQFRNQEITIIESCPILDYAKSVAKKLELEYRHIPLPEDVNLRGTTICKFDKDAAEWHLLNKYKPTDYEENVIRILNFIDFGHQMAKIVPRIRYNRTMQIFYLKKDPVPKVNTKINHKRTREWHNSKKPNGEGNEGGLLRRLGQLWLASRVRELERSGHADVAPAVLALDAAALHSHLRRVKHLLRARTYLILVPTVVLQELDELKREMSGARDAIRWLETQLQTGSRFLRAQRPGQARSLPLLRYPRKAPAHVHNFIQILEFCYHFIAEEKQPQGGGGDPDGALHAKSAPLLVLLTGNEPGTVDEQYKEFSVTGAAQAAGISVQYIGDFYAKWKHSVQKSGKKR